MPSHSVPTSPAMARTATQKGQPVTPQRLPNHRGQHRHSASQTFYKSPITPASPYTPLSLRSFTSSGSGGSNSTLNTPDTTGISVKHLSFSPEVVGHSSANLSSKDTSLADIAVNWRSRGMGNEMKGNSRKEKVGPIHEVSQNIHDQSNDSGILSAEEALLAPPFSASNKQTRGLQKNRPRAQSHAPPPPSQMLSSPMAQRSANRTMPQLPASPLSHRLNQTQNYDLLRTPPPNKALSRQIKMKGSLTDPVNVRKRENLTNLHTPRIQANKTMPFTLNNEASLDLFDIDENDLEYSCDFEHERNGNVLQDLSMHSNLRAAPVLPESYGYPDFSLPTLSTYPQQRNFLSQDYPSFDPFHTARLPGISESQEQYFNPRFSDGLYIPKPPHAVLHTAAMPLNGPIFQNHLPFGAPYPGNAAYVPLPAPAVPSAIHQAGPTVKAKEPMSEPHAPATTVPSSGCSVCLVKAPRTLAVLMPCNHPLCSGCLTSALNIVGEKDMECAVCKGKVDDFRLISGKDVQDQTKSAHPVNGAPRQEAESFMEPLFSPGSSGTLEPGLENLDSAFEFQLGLENARASTPKPEECTDTAPSQMHSLLGESVVLRIDNVPWDITPIQIRNWLQQPLERVHVLLDKKGKTMSHAYVEVADADIAGKILRGEIHEADLARPSPANKKLVRKPRERGSVLGKGRRARGVTVTKSSQEELMTNLFPNWKGLFDRSRPSLAGLANDRVITALEGGLIGETELVALLHLIKEPDSHFLKVPCLPFYCLTSLLSKTPSDVDSRVFINSAVRDILFDVAHAAFQILIPRVQNGGSIDNGYTQELVSDLAQAILRCHIFTPLQRTKFNETVESCSLDLPCKMSEVHTCENQHSPLDAHRRASPRGTAAQKRAASPKQPSGNETSLAGLAKEFGVETQLVQALIDRLAHADLQSSF